MSIIVIVLLIVAAVLFAIAAFGVAVQRFNLVAAGLFFLALALLVPALGAH